MTFDRPLILLDFLDHAEGFLEPVHCRVVGTLYNEDAEAYYVENWSYTKDGQQEKLDDPTYWTIIKSTVTAIYGLETKPWDHS